MDGEKIVNRFGHEGFTPSNPSFRQQTNIRVEKQFPGRKYPTPVFDFQDHRLALAGTILYPALDMRPYLLFRFPLLCLFVLHSSVLFLTGSEEPLTAFVFAGQSNMVGKRSEASDLPTKYRGEQSSVLIFTGEKWEPYRAGLGQPAGFGPEVSAAFDLSVALGKPIGIIKHSVGGTNLALQWNPARADNLYAALKKKVAAASKSRPIDVIGAFWMQGGADARSEEMANAYSANLDALIAVMRKDFKSPDMPFVAGRTTSAMAKPHPRYPAAAIVLAAQKKEREHYTSIGTSDITKGPDRIHYDTPGIATLGQRMAVAIRPLLKSRH